MTADKREWRIIRLLRLITRSLILLLIALFSALAAMRFAIHGREARVPNVKGLPLFQAQEAANHAGLTIFVEDKFYSSYVPEGSIISQIPVTNSRVRRGGRIRVAESIGPLRVSIPDLVGQTELAATLNLRRRGLDAVTIPGVPVSNVSPDQVIAQVPAAGATEFTSPKVSLLLAQPPKTPEYVMPNFVGRQLTEAKEKIARAGLQLASVAVVGRAIVPNQEGSPPGALVPSPTPTTTPTWGTIAAQSPPAGARITPDSQIRLSVTQ
ncbi:MAG TPA: PASTA domain-containing protein [Terriglobales bacterium]|jgi:beta-lactam-binding protein with PASTA domain|nr:PASTA domain-containing protein [Terriglobales bacterium]